MRKQSFKSILCLESVHVFANCFAYLKDYTDLCGEVVYNHDNCPTDLVIIFNMRHLFLSFVLILLSATQVSAYEKQSININVNGKQRNMVVFTPNSLPAKSPLFIVTHGMNQDPEYQYGSDKMYEMIDTAKFVIAYLRSDGNTWDTGGTKDQNFVIKTIDEMASRFDIDRDRVYWTGFSMGSMLINHCIANMQDKIAAFAPTSGIQFSEQPWNNCRKPVNLLEVIAYGDETFGYEQYGIHSYIENYALHDNHTCYSKTTGYRPISSSWFDGDLEKWTGGPNGGEVWLYSYNNGGHWPMDQNRHLIWNFCKRFSLNQPKAKITLPAGETTFLNMVPQGEAQFPDITIEATASATIGQVEKVEFYDGKTLIETLTAEPYTATLTAPQAGRHELRVVVTDSNGKTGESSCMVNCYESSNSFDLIQNFTTEGIVPQDWCVSNGQTKRVGGGLPFTSGCRLLRFTNNKRGFEYGLFVQSPKGKERTAFARYGDKDARSHMTLHAGSYALKYRLCNWNQPEFTSIIIVIEDANGQEVASTTFTPTINIGGDTSNEFSNGRGQTFNFDIPETGEYVISYYTDAVKNADFVLGFSTLQVKSFSETGIQEISHGNLQPMKNGCYDLSGRKITESKLTNGQLKPGLYIISGRKVVIR